MPKGKHTPYTAQDTAYIDANYLSLPIKRIASHIGSSYGAVNNYLLKNGLVISQEIRDQRKRSTTFQKGMQSHNKGIPQAQWMSAKSIKKTANTRFKKGHKPHNTAPANGVVRLRKDKTGAEYLYIRTSIGVWDLYHRYIWQQAHGDIPDKHVIKFKDGNTNNLDLLNLECISMLENMHRNSHMKHPPETIKSLVLITQINNKLKNLQDGKQ